MSTTTAAARALRRALVARTTSATLRPLSSYSASPLSVAKPPHLRSLQQRCMVMVTKNSSSDLPPSTQSEDLNNDPASLPELNGNAEDLLTVTPSCVKQVHSLLKKRQKNPDEMFLRVFVDAGGCSGFTYQFELDDEFIEEEDHVFAPPGSDGARVVVDEASLKLIQGSKIDYVQEMIKSAFVVNENPQSESACGCGSSFAVKNFEANPALD